MKKEKIMFEIDQLKKDKMVYALESIALTFISELFYFTFSVITGYYSKALAILCLAVPLSFFLYVAAVSILKCRKIKRLEKRL